jgi:hypothetical protein
VAVLGGFRCRWRSSVRVGCTEKKITAGATCKLVDSCGRKRVHYR